MSGVSLVVDAIRAPLNASVENGDGFLIMLFRAKSAAVLDVILFLHDRCTPIECSIILQ